jgi:hypothetical protein
MGPHDVGVEGEAAEEPGRVEGASVAGWEGTRRSEKANLSEEALLTGGSEAERPLNVREHTYTQSRTPNTQLRGLWLTDALRCRGY